MLEQLAKKDKKWLNMAFKICKDHDYARDVVQEMYLKVYDMLQKEPNKEIKEVYIFVIILNIIKDEWKRKEKNQQVELKHILNMAVQNNTFELDDESLLLIQKAGKLRALYRECLIHSYDKSLREIEEFSGVNYGYAYRAQKKARQEILGDRYETEYNNKRNKRK